VQYIYGTNVNKQIQLVEYTGTTLENSSIAYDSNKYKGEVYPTTSGTCSFCGNGVVETGEICDSGINNGQSGYCNTDCLRMVPTCGNGIVESGEVCDSGAMNGQP
jgi:hypothetical protein